MDIPKIHPGQGSCQEQIAHLRERYKITWEQLIRRDNDAIAEAVGSAQLFGYLRLVEACGLQQMAQESDSTVFKDIKPDDIDPELLKPSIEKTSVTIDGQEIDRMTWRNALVSGALSRANFSAWEKPLAVHIWGGSNTARDRVDLNEIMLPEGLTPKRDLAVRLSNYSFFAGEGIFDLFPEVEELRHAGLARIGNAVTLGERSIINSAIRDRALETGRSIVNRAYAGTSSIWNRAVLRSSLECATENGTTVVLAVASAKQAIQDAVELGNNAGYAVPAKYVLQSCARANDILNLPLDLPVNFVFVGNDEDGRPTRVIGIKYADGRKEGWTEVKAALESARQEALAMLQLFDSAKPQEPKGQGGIDPAGLKRYHGANQR